MEDIITISNHFDDIVVVIQEEAKKKCSDIVKKRDKLKHGESLTFDEIQFAAVFGSTDSKKLKAKSSDVKCSNCVVLESVLEEFDITGKTEWKGCERCGVWFCPFCSISGHESKCKESNNGKEKNRSKNKR